MKVEENVGITLGSSGSGNNLSKKEAVLKAIEEFLDFQDQIQIENINVYIPLNNKDETNS